MKPREGLLALFLLYSGGCTQPPEELDEGTRLLIAASVDSATRAFADAERDLDIERTIGHLAPDFYMYNDGVRSDYESAVTSIRSSMPSFDVFRTEWTNLEVIVLGREAAVVSFVFDDTITTLSGDTMLLRGPTTLVWQQRDEDWLIVYADADHYPPLR